MPNPQEFHPVDLGIFFGKLNFFREFKAFFA
jgi:hypothetical protein